MNAANMTSAPSPLMKREPQPNGPRPVNAGLLAGGILVIVAGTMFLLDELTIGHPGRLIFGNWPLLIAAFGITKLFDVRTVWSGLWIITIGLWLEAVHVDWRGLTYGNSWPLLLIVLGAGIVAKTFFTPSQPHSDAPEDDEESSHGTQE